ncbi:YeeE/YedE family protein [Rhodobacteraceae bacterium CCMM004]|nr:YeeE/YedE family protein [Rhodobacteraceae bacterium CCMM004]
MLYDLDLLTLPPVTAALVLGAVLGVVFGAAAQISRFCLRRGLVRGAEQRGALGVWLTALLTAILGTQAAVAVGLIGFDAHRFAAADLPWLAIALGGALFGAGMVLTRGCVSRLTVLGAGGNLRALTVLAVFAIAAHATLKGVLAPVRTGLGGITVDLGAAPTAAGLPGGAAVWTAAAAVGLAAAIWRLRPHPGAAALAAVIGLLAPAGWIGTGLLLADEFDPIPFQSLSFTLPWADTLFWTVAGTAVPASFGVGLVGGVLAGAFASAAARRELAWQSFETPGQTGRYVAGGALMGLGGVLAGGCTVGAGLSGVGTLSVAAILALSAIALGAVLTDRALDGRTVGHAVPAE